MKASAAIRATVSFALIAWATSPSLVRAADLTLLTSGKSASFYANQPGGQGSAWIQVGRDRELATLEDPTVCPASATLQISSYPTATNLIAGAPPVELPCERWRKTPDGYEYRDAAGAAGGVRVLRYGRSGITIYASTPGLDPVVGPVGFAQAWLTIGEKRYLIRFHDFTRNDARAVLAKRPSTAAAAGEAAFWDTLWDDANREEETLALLGNAVRRDPDDGRSAFLIAMMRLWRFGAMERDPRVPSARGRREILASDIAFDQAVPLLWNGPIGDTRVPGFAAAAKYSRGHAYDDPRIIEQGVAALRNAASLNRLFNGFDLLGVAFFVPPDDVLYGEVLEILDGFPELAQLCGGQAEICFNEGMAPHNLQGTFMLFGDILTKGQRRDQALSYYRGALGDGVSSGWKPQFVESVRERIETIDERLALYRDADPRNDPPFMGAGNGHGGGCAYCHNR